MILHFSNLLVVLQALLVTIPDGYHVGVTSFTIQMPTRDLSQRRINTGWIPSYTAGSVRSTSKVMVGPLFAKKKKNKKKQKNLKTSTKDMNDDDDDVSEIPTLTIDEPLDVTEATSTDCTAEKAESDATATTTTTTNVNMDDATKETSSTGTITDVLNTLLDDEENRVVVDKSDEPDISAYKLYLQWVNEQESGKGKPQPDPTPDDDRLKEIVDEVKKKFAEEDKVQEDQMHAAKIAREKAEEMERMQAEELKKRFEEEDKIRAQQIEAAREAMKKAEEMEKIQTEKLKQKFQDEDGIQAEQLSQEGSEASLFENEEPIPFPDLQKSEGSSRADMSGKKPNEKGSGRSWVNASEQIRLSRAAREAGNVPEDKVNEEALVSRVSDSDQQPDHIETMNIDTVDTEETSSLLLDLSVSDAKGKEINEAERLAASKLSELGQRALLAARLKMESDRNKCSATEDKTTKNPETYDESREEALLAAKLKLEEIRMQKPSQKAKFTSSVTSDAVPEIKDVHGTVDAFLDTFVEKEDEDLYISEADREEHDHDHDDIDMTESIVEQYGSVDEFLVSINGNNGSDGDDESEDVDMTDAIIAQYGSLEAFFSSLDNDGGDSQDISPELTDEPEVEVDDIIDTNEGPIPYMLVEERDNAPIVDSVRMAEKLSGDENDDDEEYDMTGSIIAQRHVYRITPTEGTFKSSFAIEDRQYFKVNQDNTLEAYGDRSFILRRSSKKQSVFDFELGPILLVINGLKEDMDLDDASRILAWQNAYAATLYCLANPFILSGQGLQVSSGSGLAGILSILGLGHSDAEKVSNDGEFSLTPKTLSKILMTDANESNILKCIDNLRVGMFPSGKVELGLLDPSEEVTPNLIRAFDFVLGFDCANDPFSLARIFASVLKEGSNHRFVHITSSDKEQRKLKNAVDSRLRMYSKVDNIVMDKLTLTPLVFSTQEEADLEIKKVDSSFWDEDEEVKEAESLVFTALTGYQDIEVPKENSKDHFVDNDTW